MKFSVIRRAGSIAKPEKTERPGVATRSFCFLSVLLKKGPCRILPQNGHFVRRH